MITRYASNGKLLLTGEYLVLLGAKVLAMPVRYKQWMNIFNLKGQSAPVIEWVAQNEGKVWFEAVFDKSSLSIKATNDEAKALYLKKILLEIRKLNNDFLKQDHSYKITTNTDFPVTWGLGTSSTLIANLAKSSGISPFELYFRVSNGSGYDLACALSDMPLIYNRNQNDPVFEEIPFYPSFYRSIYFVNRSTKQNSAESVDKFLRNVSVSKSDINKMNGLTDRFIRSENLTEFEEVIYEHEDFLSKKLKIKPLNKYFNDFPSAMKSLGAWGGDFMMVTWRNDYKYMKEYFVNKGLNVVIPFSDMIL